MRNDCSWRDVLSASLLLACAFTLAGCGNSYKMPTRNPTVTKFALTHHVGGTHERVLVHEGRCIIGFSNMVLVVDPIALTEISEVPLGEFGQCGPVIDLAIVDERLYAVVEDDAVAELSLEAGLTPKLIQVIPADRLGILPRHLSVVDGVAYASGVGGVVNLDTASKIYSSEAECGSVARAGDELVVCVGRRVNRISDGRFIGAASELVNLPEAMLTDTSATLGYILRSDANAMAGLMTPDVREIVGGTATIAMEGGIRRIRVLGERIFFIGSTRIDWYTVNAQTMTYGGSINILGARDIDQFDDRTFVIVGSPGRAAYQLEEASTSGRFTAAQREASGLSLATGDGLNILAGSDLGAWMYLVGSRAELTTRTIATAPPGARSASTVDAIATISPDGTTLKVLPSGGGETAILAWEYHVEKGARMHTVIAVNADFWLGHDRGITVLSADGGRSPLDPKAVAAAQKEPGAPPPVANPVKEELRIPGPVIYLYPLLAGKGASYVSEWGGFGVARFEDEEVKGPPAKKK